MWYYAALSKEAEFEQSEDTRGLTLEDFWAKLNYFDSLILWAWGWRPDRIDHADIICEESLKKWLKTHLTGE